MSQTTNNDISSSKSIEFIPKSKKNDSGKYHSKENDSGNSSLRAIVTSKIKMNEPLAKLLGAFLIFYQLTFDDKQELNIIYIWFWVDIWIY